MEVRADRLEKERNITMKMRIKLTRKQFKEAIENDIILLAQDWQEELIEKLSENFIITINHKVKSGGRTKTSILVRGVQFNGVEILNQDALEKLTDLIEIHINNLQWAVIIANEIYKRERGLEFHSDYVENKGRAFEELEKRNYDEWIPFADYKDICSEIINKII